MTPDQVLQLLASYQYLILFPISVIEGPIVTIIAGFLTTIGIMKIAIVYLVVLLGDVFGDTIAYFAGRLGGVGLSIFETFFRITPKKLEHAKRFFDTHHNKAIVASKVFYGVGTAGLIAAGVLKIPYKRYITTCFFTSVLQSAVLIFTGIIFGHLYIQIDRYLGYFVAGAIVIVLAMFVLYILYKTKGLGILGK